LEELVKKIPGLKNQLPKGKEIIRGGE
jgi:hypothetical protein